MTDDPAYNGFEGLGLLPEVPFLVQGGRGLFQGLSAGSQLGPQVLPRDA